MRRLLVSILVVLTAALTWPMATAVAAPGDTWEPRNAPQGPWAGVAFGGGLYVAVDTNKVMTSPNGITWTPRAVPTGTWTSVIYGENKFVAVASTGDKRTMTSPDGITWAANTVAAIDDDAWQSVTFGNGTFVAVGTGSTRVMTSDDGLAWTPRSAADDDDAWQSVTFGDDTFVAVASSGTGNLVMTSPTGAVWAPKAALGDDDAWQSVAYNGTNTFVAVADNGDNRVMRSTNNGETWTAATTAADHNDAWQSVVFGGGTFVAVGTGPDRVITSGDGNSWTARAAATASNWMGVAYGSAGFVAVATDAVMSSTDGITWVDRSVATLTEWVGITWGAGLFVAVANDGPNVVMTSPDGAAWTARAAPPGAWRSVTWGDGLFVAVGVNAVMTSPDGITWTARSAAQSLEWLSVSYGNGLFVAVSRDGADQVMTSPDGSSWTTRAAPDGLWRGVTFGNDVFVAVSSNPPNRVMTSPDGITWTARTAASEQDWQSVTFGNNLFVAVSSSGTTANQIMTSPDGVAWTLRTSPAANQWRSVAFGNSSFVAVSDNGSDRVMFSTNGTTWALRGPASVTGGNPWKSVAYGSGQFVAVANAGTNNRVMASGSFVAAPAISSFAPTFGPVGTTVVIFGANFSGAQAVVFDNAEATTFTVDSVNQITAKVPAGATTGRISVFTPGGTAVSATDFVVPTSDRIFGTDAIDTSIAISQAAFPSVSATEVSVADSAAAAVVLARSDFFSDALAGGPLAAQEHGSLLITPGTSQSNALDPRVLTEIQRLLDPGETVYILGGPLALSPTIDTALTNAGFDVERVFGQDQFGTALAIANLIDTPGAILEATGFNFPDALSAVPAAIQLGGVILLTRDNVQAPETQAYINAHPSLPRFAIGGPLVAAGADPGATPVFGQDLYATSAAVASKWFANADVYGVATGANFPDALSGGVFMATGGRMGAVVLVPPALPLPGPINAYLQALDPGTPGFVFGGPLAISDAVVTAVKAAVG